MKSTLRLLLCLLAAPLFAQNPYPPTSTDARVETYRKIGSTELKVWIFGESDPTVPDATAVAFERAMKKAGRPCKLAGDDGTEHGFSNRGEDCTKTLAEADAFLVALGWIKK